MPVTTLVSDLILVLLFAFLGGFFAKKLRQPLLLGYLSAGVLVSFFSNNLGLDKRNVSQIAQIGLTLLMFTIGLEFSAKKLEKLKKVVVGGAILEIILVIIFGTLLTNLVFKFDLKTAIVLSTAFSLSSTAVVVKILGEKGLSESLSGEIMTGILLVQDLAVLPIIAILPLLQRSAGVETTLIFLSKAIGILILTWFSAKKLIPKLSDLVASFKNRELLLIFAITLVFIFGFLTNFFGFSFGLGAFLAGLILSSAGSHFAIFSEIRPLRDVFLAVFFVSLGLSLDFANLTFNFFNVISLGLSFLLLKIVIISLIVFYFKYHAKTIIFAGFGLAQIGEFAFVLASVALGSRSINLNDYFLVIIIALSSMVLTPSLFLLAEKFYNFIYRISLKYPKIHQKYFSDSDLLPELKDKPFNGHIVILGYGRVGRWIGSVLRKADLPYLVVEFNPHIVRELKLQGIDVIFGDPTEIDVLSLAQIDKADLIILAIPDSFSQKMILANCKILNKKAKIICRSHVEEDRLDLKEMGVDHIIQPEFEAALSMSHKALQIYGFEKEEINERIRQIKREHDN